MSMIALVIRTANASRADVVRVATAGGTTASDWAIASAIEAAGGRPAAETMWAGHTRRPAPQAPAPTNTAAEHDPRVRIYPENTGPEDTSVAPHHPHEDPDTDQAEDETDEATQVEEIAAAVYSDLDDLLRSTCRSTGRMVRSWTTTAQARRELRTLLASHPRTRDRFAVASFAAAA